MRPERECGCRGYLPRHVTRERFIGRLQLLNQNAPGHAIDGEVMARQQEAPRLIAAIKPDRTAERTTLRIEVRLQRGCCRVDLRRPERRRRSEVDDEINLARFCRHDFLTP